MVEFIDLVPHLQKPDEALVASLRTLLSDAQNGRITSFAVVYENRGGRPVTCHHYEDAARLVAASDMLLQDARRVFAESD